MATSFFFHTLDPDPSEKLLGPKFLILTNRIAQAWSVFGLGP
jgi:hypothetical protein